MLAFSFLFLLSAFCGRTRPAQALGALNNGPLRDEGNAACYTYTFVFTPARTPGAQLSFEPDSRQGRRLRRTAHGACTREQRRTSLQLSPHRACGLARLYIPDSPSRQTSS